MSVSSDTRRQLILQKLKQSGAPLPAQALAQSLGVSRQVVVSDIAILRERGWAIQATPRGYLFISPSAYGYEGTLVCRHTAEDIAKEFYTIVDWGGVVLDIRIDHPVYGLISMPLNIRSRLDADRFISEMSQKEGQPLSRLTDGVHTHRIGAESADAFAMISSALSHAGILSTDG